MGMNENDIKKEMQVTNTSIAHWQKKFVRTDPCHSVEFGGKDVKLSITKVIEREQNICSATYGMMGLIDVAVQVKLIDEYGNERVQVMPLELKTGRRPSCSNVGHMAQVILYTLMMSDRYGLLFCDLCKICLLFSHTIFILVCFRVQSE